MAFPVETHRSDLTAQRFALPRKRFKESQGSLPGAQCQRSDLSQLFSLIQTDLQRGIRIAVIGETGSTDDGRNATGFRIGFQIRLYIRLSLRLYIRKEIVGHIVHRPAHDHHLCVKPGGKIHGILRAIAIGKHDHLRRRALPFLLRCGAVRRLCCRAAPRCCAAQRFHHALGPPQVPGAVTALHLL